MHSTANTIPSLSFKTQADEAMSRIAPLWPLERFVAVNPFVGLSSKPFSEAAALLARNAGSALALPPGYYRDLHASGTITEEDLRAVLGDAGSDISHEKLLTALSSDCWPDSETPLTVPSSRMDAIHGTRWTSFLTEEISKWCTAYFDQGQALWAFPWKDEPLFTAWRQAALIDRNPETAGLKGWRAFVGGLSDEPDREIDRAASMLGLSQSEAADVFHSLLLGISGWAGHLKFLAHEKGLQGDQDDSLRHLLAIRLVYESALHRLLPESLPLTKAAPSSATPFLPQLLWQQAHEHATRRKLFGLLARHSSEPRKAPADIQAVFCIDVRSEVFRRALESVSSQVQTIGFAGFFGFPIEALPPGETTGTAQCPVLLRPAVSIPSKTTAGEVASVVRKKRFAAAWKSFKNSAVSSFVFVESLGLGFFGKMIRDLTGHSDPTGHCSCDVDTSGLTLETKVNLAASALRHMGMSKGGLSRVVLLCGHGSITANNPYGASLDCGACGGHSGEANARTAVQILNDPAVRSALREKGIGIPDETLFLAGLHNTTTDQVTLFGLENVPSSHRDLVQSLEGLLQSVGRIARKERAPLLGLNADAPDLDALVMARSRDWAQVRPEWGLAGNHAFLAAPRERTRGLDLGGRVFLHDYRHDQDEEEATLELLLTAPVIVASWINLQYFGSTVDNRLFGSGDKVIHNVAGLLGVHEGNGGDIRTGLPFQSVHDGITWRHEPHRLTVIVEAPWESIDAVLAKHKTLSDLVSNGWIHLYSMTMNPHGKLEFHKSDGLGTWKRDPFSNASSPSTLLMEPADGFEPTTA
jgi:uncharacterized protein